MPAGIHGTVDAVVGRCCGGSDGTEARWQNQRSVYTLVACSKALSDSGLGLVITALAKRAQQTESNDLGADTQRPQSIWESLLPTSEMGDIPFSKLLLAVRFAC